jgi:hypothetical protein
MGRLIEREFYQSWRMEPVLVVYKKNYLCLIMPAKLLFYFDFNLL